MRRETLHPRPDWKRKVEDLGLVWHSVGSAAYWNESAFYELSAFDVRMLKDATETLYWMFLDAGDYVVERNLFSRFGIPDWCVPLIREAWRDSPPALNYGRFDLGYDGRDPPKLFEFNCDTPTSLLEAAVVQWFWKEEVFPQSGQFNAIHEALAARWLDIKPYLRGETVHFAHVPDRAGEDTLTTAYMMDLAREAGLTPVRMTMGDIGWRQEGKSGQGAFVDLEGEEIATLYKLYPWEWVVREPFGENLARNDRRTLWIEPIWKMIWSNKAILPILWDLFPRHPFLLWSRFDGPASDSFVRKPILAREGGNVRIVRKGQTLVETEGPYTGPVVYQDLYPLPEFDGVCPVIGSWCVEGEAAGIGIREDGLITSNLARFVPHVVN